MANTKITSEATMTPRPMYIHHMGHLDKWSTPRRNCVSPKSYTRTTAGRGDFRDDGNLLARRRNVQQAAAGVRADRRSIARCRPAADAVGAVTAGAACWGGACFDDRV